MEEGAQIFARAKQSKFSTVDIYYLHIVTYISVRWFLNAYLNDQSSVVLIVEGILCTATMIERKMFL